MPSLYESTVNTGEVASSNFTTLYNASGLSVPNAGAGQITGNLNVGGNLTVQGSSLLIGEVTLQSTLSLPNYTFPAPDGSTDQVLVTDGNGNLYWTDVSAIPGADYNISATVVTGGANLTLANTAGFTDSVKFANGTGISVSRTDANTITITNTAPDTNTTYTIDASATTGGANLNLVGSDLTTDTVKFAGSAHITVSRTDANTITISTDADNIPDGTANGQVLVWEGGAWTANSTITSSAAADRLTAVYENNTAGVNNAIFVRKDYTTSTYTTGDGTGIAFQLDSNTQATNQFASVTASWDATAPNITLSTNINNNTSGPFVSVGNFTTAQATLPGDLAVNGGDITTTATTASVFNTTATTLNVGGAANTMNVGSSSGIVNFANDINVVGGDITAPAIGIANLYNSTAIGTINIGNSVVTEVNIGNTSGSRVQIKSPTIVGANTTQAVFNTVATTVNAFGASTATNIGATTGVTTLGNNLDVNGETVRINADNTAADSYLYMKGSNEYLKWNNTNTRFELSDQLYISQTDIPAVLERRNVTADINTALEFKSGLRLIQRITDAPNNDTTAAGPGITFSRTSGATDATERIFASLGAAWDGVTTTADWSFNWSNDNFAEPTPGVFPGSYQLLQLGSNRARFQNDSIYIDYDTAGSAQVGINTGTPAYTLDVNGDANVSGDIYVSGVHVNLSTPVHQGQLLYVSDDVTPTITNSSTVTFGELAYRPTFQSKIGVSGRTQSGAGVTANTGATAFTTGDGSSLVFNVDSDSQILSTIGSISTAYDTTGDHEIRLSTSTNSFANDEATSITGGNTLVFPTAHGFSIGNKLIYSSPTQNGLTYNTTYYVISTGFTTTQCQVSTTLGGSAVALTNGTGLALYFYNGVKRLISATAAELDIQAPTILLNATNTGIAGVNAGLEVERGTSGTNAALTWDESQDRWEFTNDLYVTSNYSQDGDSLTINADSTATDSFLYMKGGSEYLKWNDTNTRFEFSDDLEVAGNVNAQSISIDDRSTIDTATLTTTQTGTPESLITTTRNVMSVLVYIVQGANTHCVNATVLRNGSSAMLTTYGEMYNNISLASFTADVSGGAIRLLVNPTSASSTVFSAVRTSLT